MVNLSTREAAIFQTHYGYTATFHVGFAKTVVKLPAEEWSYPRASIDSVFFSSRYGLLLVGPCFSIGPPSKRVDAHFVEQARVVL